MSVSSFFTACREGKPLMVQSLLAEQPQLVLESDDDGRYPLHWAVSSQHHDIVSMLLNPFQYSNTKRFEIDVDDMVDNSGWTPLHIAASVGNLEILKLLLENEPKPDVDIQTTTGQSALHFAISKNRYEVVEYLVLEAQCSVRIKDKLGQYPIHRAASIGSIKILQLLQGAKSPLDAKDRYGFTAMHHALAEGHGDFALELVRLGANALAQNAEGQTPLNVAVDAKVARYFQNGCQELGKTV